MSTIAVQPTSTAAVHAASHGAAGHHDGDHSHHPQHGFFRTYVWSHDHKMIALQYLFSAMVFGLLGGLLAMAVRWQLGYPGHVVPLIGMLLPADIATTDGAIAPGGYNMLVTMHATIMVFFVMMPLLVGVFGNS